MRKRYLEAGALHIAQRPARDRSGASLRTAGRHDRLRDLAKPYDLKMVEDACQAHGARLNTRGNGTAPARSERRDVSAFIPART